MWVRSDSRCSQRVLELAQIDAAFGEGFETRHLALEGEEFKDGGGGDAALDEVFLLRLDQVVHEGFPVHRIEEPPSH